MSPSPQAGFTSFTAPAGAPRLATSKGKGENTLVNVSGHGRLGRGVHEKQAAGLWVRAGKGWALVRTFADPLTPHEPRPGSHTPGAPRHRWKNR